MKKDKEIFLDPEEIQQLLEGGLYWTDIEPKLSPENADSFKRHISMEQEDADETVKSPVPVREFDEETDVRAILLGEEKIPDQMNELSLKEDDFIVKDRQITIPLAAATEKDDLENIPDNQVDNELKEYILSSEIEPEEEHTPFGGVKLIILLAAVAALTFGFWYYFLSR